VLYGNVINQGVKNHIFQYVVKKLKYTTKYTNTNLNKTQNLQNSKKTS